MNKLKTIHKEYQKLSLLLINTIGKALIFIQALGHGKFFERNNKSIALNILYVPYNNKGIGHAYKSEYNFKRENQVIYQLLLMVKNSIILP